MKPARDKTMLDRTADQFEVTPSRLVADAGYGEMIGWLVDERGIEQVKLIDKAERQDCICPSSFLLLSAASRIS